MARRKNFICKSKAKSFNNNDRDNKHINKNALQNIELLHLFSSSDSSSETNYLRGSSSLNSPIVAKKLHKEGLYDNIEQKNGKIITDSVDGSRMCSVSSRSTSASIDEAKGNLEGDPDKIPDRAISFKDIGVDQKKKKYRGILRRLISINGCDIIPSASYEKKREPDLEAKIDKASTTINIEKAANFIVQAHKASALDRTSKAQQDLLAFNSGAILNCLYDHYDENYDDQAHAADDSDRTCLASPQLVRNGVLGSLLQLYQKNDRNSRFSGSSDRISLDGYSFSDFESKRPKHSMPPYASKLKKKQNITEARVTVHIADLLQRHRFLLRLCKALMMYGAPTHRLEEYMVMTSRVLEIAGQFLYIPGCMIVSFGDAITCTSDVQLVQCVQGLNLWKLNQVLVIHKRVLHDIISVEDANQAIDQLILDRNLYPAWVSVLLYGFCSSMITPIAFGGDWINLIVSFGIGCFVGMLKFIVAPRWSLYNNIFEISASIVVSFCTRALGSIPNSNICFGSTVQGSLSLILPGYMILCGSLELQSRNIVAGSVRIFYAIIYSLFLGFGITLGAALFGWIYKDATNETNCERNISAYYRIIFIPAETVGLALLHQSRWSQLPMMVIISCTGYFITYLCGKHFSGSTEFAASIGAFIIGIMSNLYSRIWKGLAITTMLPGILIQVPSGISSRGTLLASVENANNIVANKTLDITNNSSLRFSLSFGITMIQVTIGVSVGLFASTLFVYPFEKNITGLFTF